MQSSLICQGCGKEQQANPRLKRKQKFCGDPVCQRARKTQWHNEKMKTDPTYRAQQ